MPSSKSRSQAQEKRIAKINGGKVQPGSGNGHHRKGDVKSARFLFEAKCRARPDAKQITVRLADLLENEIHALVSDQMGVLTIELGGRDWYLVSDMVWGELTE